MTSGRDDHDDAWATHLSGQLDDLKQTVERVLADAAETVRHSRAAIWKSRATRERAAFIRERSADTRERNASDSEQRGEERQQNSPRSVSDPENVSESVNGSAPGAIDSHLRPV